MSLFLKHKGEDCCWGVWKMDETEEKLLSMLPRREVYARCISRYAAPHRRLEWLTVRALLFTLLGEEREIAYRPSGKPYLADGSYALSISHTKGYAGVVLGEPDSEVGIDIEQYGERVCKVAHKFMRPDEQALAYEGNEAWSLLLHWSAKETMFKCLNASEVDFKEHLQVFPFIPRREGTFDAREYRTDRRQMFHISYQITSDFVLTWSVVRQ